MNEEHEKYIKIEVGGKNPELWEKMKGKFLIAVHKLLDSVANVETGTTYRQELMEYKSLIVDFGKEKLKKAGYDNEKTIAEIDLLYGQKTREMAEARKLNAEAWAIETDTAIKNLRIALLGLKILMSDNESELLFVKEVEKMITLIASFKEQL